MLALGNNVIDFNETLKVIKKSINPWKWRSLSLLGRIQIVRTFAIPKLMYRASVIALPKDLVKEVNSILYMVLSGTGRIKLNVRL